MIDTRETLPTLSNSMYQVCTSGITAIRIVHVSDDIIQVQSWVDNKLTGVANTPAIFLRKWLDERRETYMF